MNEVTKTVATKSHFNQLPSGTELYNEIVEVLPHIGISLDDLKKIKTKKEIMKKGGVLGKYLDLVKKIAKEPSLNSLTNDDLSDKSEDEILKIFVRADKSSRLAAVQQKIDNERKLLRNVFEVAAKEISPYYIKLLGKSSTHGNDVMWANGEDASTDTGVDAGATTTGTVADENTNNDNNNNT